MVLAVLSALAKFQGHLKAHLGEPINASTVAAFAQMLFAILDAVTTAEKE